MKYSIEQLHGPYRKTSAPFGHTLPSLTRNIWYAYRSDGAILCITNFNDQPDRFIVDNVLPYGEERQSLFAVLDYICETEFTFLT